MRQLYHVGHDGCKQDIESIWTTFSFADTMENVDITQILPMVENQNGGWFM